MNANRINLDFPDNIFPITKEGLYVMRAGERGMKTTPLHPDAHVITGEIELVHLKSGQILDFEGFQACFGRHDLSERQIEIMDVYPGSPITKAWVQYKEKSSS